MLYREDSTETTASLSSSASSLSFEPETSGRRDENDTTFVSLELGLLDRSGHSYNHQGRHDHHKATSEQCLRQRSASLAAFSGSDSKKSAESSKDENPNNKMDKQGSWLSSFLSMGPLKQLTAKRNHPLPLTKRSHKVASNKPPFVLRSKEEMFVQFLIGSRMFCCELPTIVFIFWYQWFHSAVHNIAYYQQAQLSAANRMPLQDLAFDILPSLDGAWWNASEYLLYAMLIVIVPCLLSPTFVRWNAPHGRPIYLVQMFRQMGMTWVVCQTLRMVSFLVTTLPGASRQCRYSMPDGLSSMDAVHGVAPSEGNPDGYNPPETLHEILFRVDPYNGCGDLMFSSHIIFTMSLVCVTFKYFDFFRLKWVMAFLQASMIPFMLAARKHYSVDVFTALYVVPIVFELLSLKFPDRDTCVSMEAYDIRFYPSKGSQNGVDYVVKVWAKEYPAKKEQLPFDHAERDESLLKTIHLSPSEKNRWDSSLDSTASIV